MSNKSERCPTCDSPSPELHPAVQHEGEVEICKDQWHGEEAAHQETLGLWQQVKVRIAELEAEVERLEELEDADLCLSQLRADNLDIRATRDALAARVRELEQALELCDVSMDTAARLGVGELLPPGYRDSWARAHLAARAALGAKP